MASQSPDNNGPAIETTPLLAEDRPTDPEDGPRLNSGERSLSPRRASVRVALVGSWVSLTFALATVVAHAAILVMSTYSRYGYDLPWQTRDSLAYVAVGSLAAVVFSGLNLGYICYRGVQLPRLLNIVVDAGLITYVGISSAVAIFDFAGNGGGYCDDGDCEPWKRVFEPVVWLGLALALLLSITHAFLLVYRTVEAYRAWPWGGGGVSRLRIPTGQLTFEFTIKLLRQQTSQDRGGSRGEHTERAVQAEA